MSKYNLTDILNEYVGGSRIGTYPSTAMDLVRTMDDLERNNPNLEIRRADGSGDGKTSISFTVVEKGQDPNKQEKGFTVYDYKVGDWKDERGEYEGAMDYPDMDVNFSIGGNDLNMALELLPGAVEFALEEEKMSPEEEIENIKRMNPKAEERYLKKIAKMGKSKAVKTGEKMGFDMRGIDEDEAPEMEEVMGIDRLGRKKSETEPTDLSRAKMKLREDMNNYRRAVKDISGISDEDKEELARAIFRFSLTNFTKSDKGDVFFHDKNTIQQLGKRSKAYADKIGISSNTPYYNSIEYYEKKQFGQVKDFIKNRLQIARLGLKAVMSGMYTDEEVAVYKPLLQDQVAMLMQLDDMDDNALEDLFRRNPSTDKEWQELFRKHPKGNLDKQFKFKTDTDIKSINSKKPNITADDEIDAELGNALANLDRDEEYERLMQAVNKLRGQGKDAQAADLKRRGDSVYGREEMRGIDEGFVKSMHTMLSDYGSPMEINTYMDSLGNEFRLSPDSKDQYDDFSEDDWIEDFRVYVDDKSLREHFRRFNIKKYS